MDLTGVQRLVRSLPPASRLPAIIHNLTPNSAPIIFSYDGPASAGYADGWVRLGPASDTAPQQRPPHADRSRSSLGHVT
jgi:hypothetical protein